MSEERRPRAKVSPAQRVAILVDVQNMFYSAKHLHRSKLDYSRVLEGALDGRLLVRAIAYIIQKADVDQSGFHEALARFGYELKIKELKIRQVEGSERTIAKGSWDIGIAVDAMLLAPKIDTLILVTGDGDYSYLSDTIRNLGVRVEVVSFEGSTASELVRSCDRFVPIKQEWIFVEKKFQDSEQGDEEQVVEPVRADSSFGVFGDDEKDPPQPSDYR